MRILRLLTVATGLALAATTALAQTTVPGVPRNETLILENPEGTIKNPGWFNIWTINAGGQYTGLHQLAIRSAASMGSGKTRLRRKSRFTTRTSPR